MPAKLNTFTLVGIEAAPVETEVDVSSGLPKTVLVGLPEAAVRESIHHIEKALVNRGYSRHPGQTVINLAPADLPKNAGGFDLPIALGILTATDQLAKDTLPEYAVVGELALDYSIRPIKGALAMAMAAANQGIFKMLVPAAKAHEAAVVEQVAVYPIHTLDDAVGILSGQLVVEPINADIAALFENLNRYPVDFSDVRGQEFAERALVASAAGDHNVLIGPPPAAMIAGSLPISIDEGVPHLATRATPCRLPLGTAVGASQGCDAGQPQCDPRT